MKHLTSRMTLHATKGAATWLEKQCCMNPSSGLGWTIEQCCMIFKKMLHDFRNHAA